MPLMHRRASTAFKMALLALAVSLLVYVTVSYAQSYQNEAALPEAGSGGGYGVMDTNVTGCQLINAPGAYVLIGNVSGASTLPYWPGATACILINNTSNVNFNCNGFTINVSGTSL